MNRILKILNFILCIGICVSLIVIMFRVEYLIYNNRNFSNKNNSTELNKSDVLSDKYYIREVKYLEDPFDVPKIDTIIILDQKKGFVKWSFLNSYRIDSNSYISTRYSYLINRIKPINKK